MTSDYLSLFASGLMPMPGWGYVVVTLTFTQITIAAVTIYLPRGQAHHALALHPVISHFFRFWLWLTTGIVTKEWVAIHREHHAKRTHRRTPTAPRRTASRRFSGKARSYTARSPETSRRCGSTVKARRMTGSNAMSMRDFPGRVAG
jgi:stearoyl-CoA desaturase (delta-9 desaturase)